MFEGMKSEPEMEWPSATYPETTHPDDEHHVEPVPVFVVDTNDNADLTDWAPNRFAIDGNAPQLIAGADQNRTRVVITNIGLNNVYLVKSAVSAQFLGAVVPVNGVVTLTTNRAVYAICKPTEVAEIGVIQEYKIDADG